MVSGQKDYMLSEVVFQSLHGPFFFFLEHHNGPLPSGACSCDSLDKHITLLEVKPYSSAHAL